MKLTARLISPGLFVLALGVYDFNAGREDVAMNTLALAAERPAIDLAIPAKLETATFALG